LILLFAGIFAYKASTSYFRNEDNRITRNEILHLDINGVILNGKKFLGQLKKYKRMTLLGNCNEINSPGGAVGPSQEIYYEF